MQLTLYTDYSLRVLIYLSLNRDRTSTISEIADFYQISRNHLVKVVHNLSLKGYINSSRGKGGGLVLAHDPKDINVGIVVRDTEPNFHIVDCFNEVTTPCSVEPLCKLKGILGAALGQFLQVLDQYNISDMLANPETGEAIISLDPQIISLLDQMEENQND
ncbi:MAG: Rrf2 family transcriptional regulator [Gammaproteobacteria bacterium]|nr:Rrf2 family transcriptional regulator [Gammaproteobacteria bacterium]